MLKQRLAKPGFWQGKKESLQFRRNSVVKYLRKERFNVEKKSTIEASKCCKDVVHEQMYLHI